MKTTERLRLINKVIREWYNTKESKIHRLVKTLLNPARRRVDRHTGPAESDNPEVQGLHSEATTVQSSKSNSSRLLA